MTYCTFLERNNLRGANAVEQRVYKNRYEKQKQLNDDIDRRNDQYKRAGYSDKVIDNSKDKAKEKYYQDGLDYIDVIRNSPNNNRNYKSGVASKNSYKYFGGGSLAKDINDSVTRKNTPRNKNLHDRINNRTKNESAGIFGNIDII